MSTLLSPAELASLAQTVDVVQIFRSPIIAHTARPWSYAAFSGGQMVHVFFLPCGPTAGEAKAMASQMFPQARIEDMGSDYHPYRYCPDLAVDYSRAYQQQEGRESPYGKCQWGNSHWNNRS